MLTDEAHSLYIELSKDPSAFCRYSANRFRSIITKCQIVGSEIWTMINGLWDDPYGKEQALDVRLDRLHRDVSLLRLGRGYWRQNAEVHTNQSIDDYQIQLLMPQSQRCPLVIIVVSILTLD
jgi:hypothetical protein